MIKPAVTTNRRLSFRSPLIRALLAALIIVSILATFQSTNLPVRTIQHQISSFRHKPSDTPPELDCSINGYHLEKLKKKYELDDEIEYAQRYIRFHQQDTRRRSVTRIDDSLFPKAFDTFKISEAPLEATCLAPFEVPVTKSPDPSTADASDFLFGISTTFKRLNDPKIGPIKEWSHWLTDGHGKSNGAGLVLRLIDASDAEITETEQKMRALGIDVKVYRSDSNIPMAQRYLSLLPALYNDSSRRERKWLVMCDDDTFFPSMNALIEKLAVFDYNQDLYIGTLSEDVNNVQRHGSQAFGGAGVFFTVSLATKINALYAQCSTEEKLKESDSGWGSQGDIMLRKCIYEHTDVRLSMIHDLYQLDLFGDPSGFYEAGLKPYSLHHFKGGMWHVAKPYQGVQVSHACGEDCFLQRFQSNDDYIIANGYSIAYYPKGIDFDIHQMERTFAPAPDDYGWNLDFKFGPQRKSLLKTGRKAAWHLQESEVQKDGSVRQVYIRKKDDERWQEGPDGPKMFEKDSVVELIWISA
ncbi:hypothetical protein F5884DRAFT_81530 [Xylogone sp. PMI_703]|nr:hypothetical protein F5884DRAFT_81530 [Xylogone sp. PMI_703]